MLRRKVQLGLNMVVLAAVWCSLLACSEQFSGPEDALGDTAERIEQVILPPIVADTEAMLRNYLISVLRYVSRNKAFTFINVFGLAIGMMACILTDTLFPYLRRACCGCGASH